jgi:RNA polymerase sigma-70 factor, ECF subfamily
MPLLVSSAADPLAQIQPVIPALRRYARGLLGDREDADDLVQDTLERALARWRQHREGASTRTWLFTILHNLAMDRLRRRARHGRTEPIEGVSEEWLAVAPEQGAALARRDVLALIELLPEEQRSVLLLVGVEELSYAEAAAVLGAPQGTVMSRLSRARERLRRMMDGERPATTPALRVVR